MNRKRALQNNVSRYLVFLVLFFALLYLRRSVQLLNPQVWDEDGTQIVPGLIDHGFRSLAYPVNGYLVVLPKLISALSLAISGIHYPLVSTVITWLFIIGVCMMISLCPTCLKGGALLGVFTLLVPCDPEVFGIPLYSFWWASLLLFLVVLWDSSSKDLKLRLSFILIGGLSSPIIFVTTPFLAFRAAASKDNKRELVIFGTALFCCCAQAFAMFHSRGLLADGGKSWTNLGNVLPKFLGSYLAGNFIRRTPHLLWIATGFLLVFLLTTLFHLRRHHCYLYMVGLWGGTVCLVGLRVDLSVLQPRYAGPRYFFLPFVLLAWYLVSLLAESKLQYVRLVAAALLLVSIRNMLPVRIRPQRDFQWAAHVTNCAQSDPFSIPISFDGERPWFLLVNRHQCSILQRAGLIHMSTKAP